MIHNFPQTLTDWSELQLPGRLSLASKNESVLQVNWVNGGLITTLTIDMIARTIEIPDAAEQALKDTLQLKVTAFDQLPAWATAYEEIKTDALAAVGVRLDQLTTKHREDLLSLLLFDHKAIADDMTIKPLNQWVKRRL